MVIRSPTLPDNCVMDCALTNNTCSTSVVKSNSRFCINRNLQKKACNHSTLILWTWLPASDHQCKQARTVHAHLRTWTFWTACSRIGIFCRYSVQRETRAESSSYLKRLSNGITTHNFFVVNNLYLFVSFPFGSAPLSGGYGSPSLSCIVWFLLLLV